MSEAFSAEMPERAGGAERPTLAARLAERGRQRALRAERLARLRPAARNAETVSGAAQAGDEAEAALHAFLRALTGDQAASAPVSPGAPAAGAAEVLSFQRPERMAGETAGPVPASDLESLPGVGPNLVWALEQAGVGGLADLAALEPADLAGRLGPIGRLVPAADWIAAARAAVPAG